jgi:cysteinyl-tRNA synthetase
MSGGKPTKQNLIDMSSALRFLGLQLSAEEGRKFVRRAGKRADYIRQSYSGPFSSRGEIDAVYAMFDRVDVNEAIVARAEARKAKDYAEADRIRAELDAMGIALKDSKDPETGELVTTWEVKR